MAAEEAREAEGLARAKAANAQLDYELQVGDVQRKLEDDVATGTVPYADASSRYQEAVGKIEKPAVAGLTPDLQLAYDRGLQRTVTAGQLGVDRVARTARRADFRGQFDAALDKLGKIAGMPGADIAAVNQRAQAFAPLAKQAGLSDAAVGKALQDFYDRTWTSQATQRAIFNREDPAGLKSLETDLSSSDGFYADKLDPEKRNALLSQVMTRQQTLVDRAERAADRIDAKAQRVLGQIDRQIASAVPATPEMWTAWADSMKGASPDVRAEFDQRVAEEKEVQKVLRMPTAQQQTYLQKAEAELATAGGTVQRKENLARTRSAIEAAQKQLDETPLLFNASREGGEVEPLNLAALASPADAWEVGAQLQNRAATIDGMRKRYGSQVQMAVLLPQEVQALGEQLKQGTSRQQAEMLSQLRTATMDDKVFNAAMKQLAPEQPVVAYAGMLATRERAQVTLQKHMFGADEAANGRDVAATMLEGNRLLQGKGDSKFPLPPEKEFRDQFTRDTGALFAGRPGAADVAMQAVRAFYTGQSAADGDHSAEVNSDRMKKAITASLGEVVDVNGRGEVLAPWGMGADTFEDQAEQAFTESAKAAGFPDTVVGSFSKYGLRQQSERTYYVTRGREFLTTKDGKPLTITITGSGR
ncbi:TPA: hypothetical protein UL918_000046 [Stenotrophomonas maltophilia]|uniref:hypothetical protein n=1 Tax=Stenotrophomonas maltophilia TaxID=40324 RepID=UPI0015DF46B4|nr:hypothetical protein [Stenotrophomonas maltophilia]MBN4986104.1 hypothetical protein [Stenotrophomonas maltophilia]HDS1091588.1 hypothetical protein [Stenotrophomonas maltophilia]HEL7675718.1 hypothetical protein [Stenotrophomonas maltophilia]